MNTDKNEIPFWQIEKVTVVNLTQTQTHSVFTETDYNPPSFFQFVGTSRNRTNLNHKRWLHDQVLQLCKYAESDWSICWGLGKQRHLACHPGVTRRRQLRTSLGRVTFKNHDLVLSSSLISSLCACVISLTFRHRASCILGQAFHYSSENAFYIFNQQIYFIIWYLLDRSSLI